MLSYFSHNIIRKLRIPLLACILIALFSTAQSQVNIWYFGQNAGVEFNTNGVAVPLLNGNMNTPEGCASIMGSGGVIANYSNGEKLWIGGSSTIISGLSGDKQATQSAAFLRKPQDPDTVYLFTLDADAGPDGLCYSVIVNKNIVPGLMNIPIQSNVTERMCIVQHCNNMDAWLIVHGWNDNKFYAYRITGEGIDVVPTVSAVGSVHNGNIMNAIGYMKVNQLGDKLAIAKMGSGVVELFHFDNVHGIVSNPISLTNLSTPYGIEFNALGNRLYVATASGSLYNYDVSNWSMMDIQNSRSLISQSNNLLGALQIGPDNKIYVAQDNSHFLGYIAAPDNLGVSCYYYPQAIYLEGFISEAGLPPYIKSDHSFVAVSSNACIGDTCYFNVIGDPLRIDSLIWNFGDPSSVQDVSNSINPYYVYPAEGLYPCSLLVYHCEEVDTFEILTQVIGAPEVNLGHDTSLCDNQTLQLNVNPTLGTNYIWQDGSTSFTHSINKVGNYWVRASSICGTATDTIEILNVWSAPIVNLPNDTTVCDGDSLILDGGAAFTCIWENKDTSRFFVVHDTGSYHLQIYDSNQCVGFGDFVLKMDYLPVSKLGNDTIICQGDFIELRAGNAQFFEWQDFSTSHYFTTTLAGTYWVELTNHCGSTHDSIQVEVEDCDVDILIPNAFSPNGDNINDVFMPKTLNVISFSMQIYTRLGQYVFETHDISEGWDGRINGQYAKSDAYFYLIRYMGQSGQEHIRKGFVNLIR